MAATKEQELKALEKIKKIVADLGEDSYIGRDDWGRYVYEDENGKLWKNTDCCSPRECCEERGDTLNSSAGNEFDGEPDCFMAAHIKVEYLPEEGGEQDG